MEKVNATHDFESDGTAYRMDIFHLSDHPLVYRHEFLRRDGDQWIHVAFDDREYDDPTGKGNNPAMVDLLKREAPLMAREFLTYLAKKTAKKKRAPKKRKKA